MDHRTVQPRVPMSKHRLEAFSDGVFAIAITILVLNLKLPEIIKTGNLNHDLWRAIIDQWPKLLSYMISFGIVGLYWVGHHLMFHYIKHTDRMFLFLNNVYLMVIAFMPFPAALLGQYGGTQTAIIVYAGTLIVAGLLYTNLWRYATKNHRLVDPNLSDRLIHLVTKIISFGPLIYVFDIGLSFINPRLSLIILVIVPLLYIVPGPIDRLMSGEEEHVHTGDSSVR